MTDTKYWLQTSTGRAWDYERPQASNIDLRDMAHGLARQARFYGHTTSEITYSVAEHSVRVAGRVEELLYTGLHGNLRHSIEGDEDQYPAIVLSALLHDAAECWLGDWVSPLKSLMRSHSAAYGCILDDLETWHNAAIAEYAGLPNGSWLSLPVIKRADLELLATEARDLMAPAPKTWKENPWQALPGKIEPWPWQKARDVFADEFHRLRRAAGLHRHCVAGAGYRVAGMEE